MNKKSWDYRPNNNKKVMFVVRVDDYWPELCDLTFPNLKSYAEKIGAEFIEITERKYPDFPPTYEKLQVYDLGKENEWNILIDADFILHPLTPDFTMQLKPEMIGIDYGYDASAFLDTRSKYFQRDGRNRGIATGLVVSNNLTHDLWTPLQYNWEQAKQFTKREFIIDEYCLSLNLARYGLQYTGLFQEQPKLREKWLIHLGAEEKTKEEKQKVLQKARKTLYEWGQL